MNTELQKYELSIEFIIDNSLRLFDVLRTRILDNDKLNYIATNGLYLSNYFGKLKYWQQKLTEYEQNLLRVSFETKERTIPISDNYGDVTRMIEANIEHYEDQVDFYYNLITNTILEENKCNRLNAHTAEAFLRLN